MGLRSGLKTLWRETPNLRRFVRRVAIVVAIIVAVFVAARIVGHLVYSRRLEREMERFKALGGTTNLAELAPKPYARQGINPARYLEAAGLIAPEKRMRSVYPGNPGVRSFVDPLLADSEKVEVAVAQLAMSNAGDLFVSMTPGFARYSQSQRFSWNDGWLPWLERHLDKNADALALIRRGAAGEGGVFEVDWSKGMYTGLGHLSGMHSAAGLLNMSAIVRARRGDVDGATEDVLAGLRLRRPLDAEPYVGSKLTAYALDSVAFASLQVALDAGRPNRAALEAALRELDGREEANRLTRQYMWATAHGVQAIEAARRDADAASEIGFRATTDVERFLVKAFMRTLWVGAADEAEFVSIMNRCIENSRTAYPGAIAGMPACPRFTTASDLMQAPFMAATAYLLSANSLERSMLEQAQADTKARLARSVIALTLYHMDNGRYPEALQELVPKYLPEVQTDPFTGKALLYQLRDNGFVVYSTGQDGFDNDGVGQDWHWGPGGDVTWERR